MDVLALRDWPTFRQWLQVVGATVLAALVAYHVVDQNAATVILTFVAAVLPPALSVFNSADGRRTFIYGFVLAAQALIVGLNVWSDVQVTPIVNILLALLGAGVAVTHTPTPLAADKV